MKNKRHSLFFFLEKENKELENYISSNVAPDKIISFEKYQNEILIVFSKDIEKNKLHEITKEIERLLEKND